MEDGGIDKVIELPEDYTPEWAQKLSRQLGAATRIGLSIKSILPAETAAALFHEVAGLLSKEPTLVEVAPPSPQATITIVGDTHGQLHDVIGPLMDVAGLPSTQQHFVFNGDFVDRGAWGLELLAVLAAWKLALPSSVILLRGNHESITCTKLYGFFAEISAKYGAPKSKAVFKQCKRMFAALPLAACIAGATLVVHGGLFRKPPTTIKGKKRRRKAAADTPVTLGSLDDLRSASKGGMDPSGQGSTVIAADVMWSDPSAEAGISLNDSRGVGIIFGPDVTEQFLRENALKLIIRSHEGPDARADRDDMPPMTPGHSVDHVTASGKLMTVFSAPDYPQFQLPGERYENMGAVLRLSAPDYATPDALQFSASLPRPEADPYYDLGVPDSDEEIELGGHQSEVSGASVASDGGSLLSTASDACLDALASESATVRDDADNDVAEFRPVQTATSKRADDAQAAPSSMPVLPLEQSGAAEQSEAAAPTAAAAVAPVASEPAATAAPAPDICSKHKPKRQRLTAASGADGLPPDSAEHAAVFVTEAAPLSSVPSHESMPTPQHYAISDSAAALEDLNTAPETAAAATAVQLSDPPLYQVTEASTAPTRSDATTAADANQQSEQQLAVDAQAMAGAAPETLADVASAGDGAAVHVKSTAAAKSQTSEPNGISRGWSGNGTASQGQPGQGRLHMKRGLAAQRPAWK